MGLLTRQVWLNFLSLRHATTLAVLTLATAFLRLYNTQDFPLLGEWAYAQVSVEDSRNWFTKACYCISSE